VPPYPPVPGVLRVTFKHTENSETGISSRVFLSYTGTAPSNAQCSTFATSCASAWNSDLAALANTGLVLVEVDVVDLTSTSSGVGTASVSHAGTRTGNALPLNSCFTVNYTIARRYRGGKPRGFWRWGVAGDQLTERTWDSTIISAVQTDFAAFIAACAAAGWSGAGTIAQVNVSYFEGFTTHTGTTGRVSNIPKPRVGGPITDAVTAILPDSFIGTQRRRIRAA
jgi:hypothetical protein